MSNFELNNRQGLLRMQRGAKPQQQQHASNPETIPAIILRANGDGWDVAALDGNGNKSRVFQRVFSHPFDATLTSGQRVWLWVPQNGQTPLINPGGGGGGASCYQSATQWAAYWD